MFIRDLDDYAPRWQGMVMLFAALAAHRGGVPKADAIAHIRENLWFDVQTEDRIPYPSNRYTSKEPRWITSIAWARKDAVERELMHKGGFNDWDLTTTGLTTFAAVRRACSEERLAVSRCYLWSHRFKSFMDPKYGPSPADAKRPATLYEDWLPRKISSLLTDL